MIYGLIVLIIATIFFFTVTAIVFVGARKGLLLISLIVLVILCLFLGAVYGNKQGQIKALTGKADYELVTQPDSSRVWKYKVDE